MTCKKFGDVYIAKLQRGEEVVAGLMRFAREEDVKFAWVIGLGAFSEVTLGYYNLEEKEYHFETKQGDLEITCLMGNIAWMGDDPVVHVHLTVSDPGLKSFGGHLKEAVVGGTLELKIEIFDQEVSRGKDEETGLNLLEFSKL